MSVITVEYGDVKRKVLDVAQDGKRWSQAQGATLRALYQDPYAPNEWAGGSGADTLGWLRNGYFAPEFETSAHTVKVSEKTRVAWSEEDGDIDVGRLYGGYDDFYLATSPSEAKPGLRIVADCFFAASVPAATVKAYGAWLAGLIGTLEANGFDLEIALAARVTALYETGSETADRKRRDDVHVNVKRSGELSDFTEWSALFAPTGLRHLIFTAFGLAAEKLGKRQTDFMCMSLPKESWGVTYDADENVLTITGAQRAGGVFPLEMMNRWLAESGLI